MKIIFKSALILSVLIATSCKPQKEKSEAQTDEILSEISFTSNVHDFGDIPYESDGRCYFEFINDSEKDIIINNVRTSCGCTRPEWPEEPIAPGEMGKIGITYNTKIPGRFSKSITVYANTENSPIKLFIKGNVEPEPEKISN